MRTIAYKSTSVLLCLALSFGLLLGSLAVPRRAHAFLPVIGGAAAAVGLTEVAEVGVFAALLAACGFSLANAVGANPDVPIADWSDGQLTEAQRKLQSASEYSEWLDLTYFLNNAPDPPTEPPNDNGNGKKQPKKEDATSDLDYMIALMGVNGALAFAGGLADGVTGLVKWATAPESQGGGGFSTSNAVYPAVTSPDGRWTFNVSPYSNPNGYVYDESRLVISTGTAGNNGVTYTDTIGRLYTDMGTAFMVGNPRFDSQRGSFYVTDAQWYAPGIETYQGTTRPSGRFGGAGSVNIYNGSFPGGSGANLTPEFTYDMTYISPQAALLVNENYRPSTVAELLYEIAGQNAQMQQAMQQMQNDTSAAVTTLQQIYANDLAQSQAGTPQYLTVQAPYYVQSGQTDPHTGQYTANIVANDYNQGVIAEYSNAVASNTSSPQPGNTGYSPGDYTGNSSSDIPPWQPLLDIHLDRVWPFSLIGDSYKTFDDVFSMDGGSEWDWHITIPLSSWNIALGGAAVFDDYDLDLSIWRELFAYLAPWFLLFVFLSLLDMARRLWLRWNSSGDGD